MTGSMHPDPSMRALKLAQTAVDAAASAAAIADKARHEALAARSTADANSVAIRESADRCSENFGKVARELGELRDVLRALVELITRDMAARAT